VNAAAGEQQPEFTLEVLRAEHGDCLLLNHGRDIVLIDGGPHGTYEATLKPRLDQIGSERTQPLWIRMVIVSHIDDDHIVGLADMFAEARERREERRGAAQWRAGELWFNAFGKLTGAGTTAVTPGVHGAALEALVTAAPLSLSKAVAAGVASGNALQQDASGLGVEINKSFPGGLVQSCGDDATVEAGPGLTLTVIAPAPTRLAKLRERWEKWVREHADADARTTANLDRSVFNLSSIVVLARSGPRSMLLTGDAASDDIVAGLEAAKLLTDDAPLKVDILKLPHHGSIRNVDASFFDRVQARHYVISANGRDGNPDDATLALLFDARRNDSEPWTLWLTYGGEPNDGKPGLHERLDAFLSGRHAAGQDVDARFAKPGESHVINARPL
jgi:beta-lactamase superfamily II metal-dependent hydrolase